MVFTIPPSRPPIYSRLVVLVNDWEVFWTLSGLSNLFLNGSSTVVFHHPVRGVHHPTRAPTDRPSTNEKEGGKTSQTSVSRSVGAGRRDIVDFDCVDAVVVYRCRSSRFKTGFVRIRGERGSSGSGSDAVVYRRGERSDERVDVDVGVRSEGGTGPEKKAEEGCAGGYGERGGTNPGITGVAVEGIPKDWCAKPRV